MHKLGANIEEKVFLIFLVMGTVVDFIKLMLLPKQFLNMHSGQCLETGLVKSRASLYPGELFFLIGKREPKTWLPIC